MVTTSTQNTVLPCFPSSHPEKLPCLQKQQPTAMMEGINNISFKVSKAEFFRTLLTNDQTLRLSLRKRITLKGC